MSVWGHLSTLHLPDILHWISGNHLSGRLLMQKGSHEVELAFDHGHLHSLRSGDESGRFGSYLVAVGLLTEERVASLIEKREGGTLGRRLVDADCLTEDEVAENLRQFAVARGLALFSWEGGTFEFHPSAASPHNGVPIPISVHEFVLEVHRRLDELDRIGEPPPIRDTVEGIPAVD